MLPSPFSTTKPICVCVVGVNLFNVISAMNDKVAPFTATLLYLVCFPDNVVTIDFVPSSLSTKFDFTICNSSSKYSFASFIFILSIFDGKLIITVGFSYIKSSILSFSKVALISTSVFSITVDKLSLLAVIEAF